MAGPLTFGKNKFLNLTRLEPGVFLRAHTTANNFGNVISTLPHYFHYPYFNKQWVPIPHHYERYFEHEHDFNETAKPKTWARQWKTNNNSYGSSASISTTCKMNIHHL